MSIKLVKGNIIKLIATNDYNYVWHGCNTLKVMGAGIAKILVTNFPEIKEADQRCENNTIGNFSTAVLDNGTVAVNIYLQTKIGYNNKDKFRYDGWQNFLNFVKQNIDVDKSILMPKIGSGLAGGNWDRIETMLVRTLPQHNITICIL